MDLAYSPTQARLLEAALAFVEDEVIPAEPVARDEAAARPPEQQWDRLPVVDRLRDTARELGLWDLWVPEPWGQGLGALDAAPVAEASGRSPHLAPTAMNSIGADVGTMRLLAAHGTPEQQEQWLRPLADGTIRSAIAMTEPGVASSDAHNIATQVREEGDELVLTGHKWWTTGAMAPDCAFLLVMAQSAPQAMRHRQHSLVIVPRDAPGLRISRNLTLLGQADPIIGGHADIVLDEVRVPRANLVGDWHGGYSLAQERMNPSRLLHGLRLVGVAERAFDLMAERVQHRVSGGRVLGQHGLVQEWIGRSRIEIDQARMLAQRAAWFMDRDDERTATAVSQLKVVAPAMAGAVVDRSMQALGALGVGPDTMLPELYSYARMLRLQDGPDEVHLLAVARRELRRYS